MKKEGVKKEARMSAKCVHVTMHKLTNDSKEYWLDKGMSFRYNTVACLVGMEENYAEGKGLHAHIVIQFSTKQTLSRKQFVEHFGTDSLHVATKPNKEALIMALGYVSKTGNMAQRGVFTYKGVDIDANPEVYRFKYQVKSVGDAFQYFHKVICEHIGSAGSVIEKIEERGDEIGIWLQRHSTHYKTLVRLERSWKLKHRNETKKGISFKDWVDDKDLMEEAYKGYLKVFPRLFRDNLPQESGLELEGDYGDYMGHDLGVARKIIALLKIANRHKFNRAHKSLNLYLWSTAPSFGKTRLLNLLNDNMVAYRLPDDQYYVDYDNYQYHVLVSDEAEAFLKTKPYSHLKMLFEGLAVEFNRKQKGKVMKEDNPLIVLADNVSFERMMRNRFHDDFSKEVFDTRVLDLEIKSRATLHFLIDRCIVKGTYEQQKLNI